MPVQSLSCYENHLSNVLRLQTRSTGFAHEFGDQLSLAGPGPPSLLMCAPSGGDQYGNGLLLLLGGRLLRLEPISCCSWTDVALFHVARPGLPLVKVMGSRGRSTLYLEVYVLKWHKAVLYILLARMSHQIILDLRDWEKRTQHLSGRRCQLTWNVTLQGTRIQRQHGE